MYNIQQFIHCYIKFSFLLNERYSMFLNFTFSVLFYSYKTYLFKIKTNKFLCINHYLSLFSLFLTNQLPFKFI